MRDHAQEHYRATSHAVLVDLHCEHCGQRLDRDKAVWLEFSFRTGRWYHAEQCPPDESQGYFPFGRACARKVVRP